MFLRGVQLYERAWNAIALLVVTRTALQIRTHYQKYSAKIANGEVFPEEVRACCELGLLRHTGGVDFVDRLPSIRSSWAPIPGLHCRWHGI